MSSRLKFIEYTKIILLQLIILILLFQPIGNSLNIFILPFLYMIPGNFIYMAPFIALILLYAPICIIHELFTCLAYKLICGSPRIGFKGLYAYMLECSGKELSRTELLIMLLMPVTVISLICIIVPWNIIKLAFFLNLLGSCRDLYMSLWLCRVDSNMRIIDKSYGFDVLRGFEILNF